MTKISIKRREDKKSLSGKGSLCAVFYLDREKIRYPIGISVTKDEWDAKNEIIRGRGKDVLDANLIIENTRSRIAEILVKHRLSGKPLRKLNFLKEMKNFTETEDFQKFAEKSLSEYGKTIEDITIRHHQAVFAKVREFAPDLLLSEITTDWVKSFVKHLKDVQKNSLSTIRKNMSVLKVHLQRAYREGKIRELPFEGIKLKTDRPSVSFLRVEELERLIRLYRSKHLDDNKQDVLRFFLFMTFTGMHISDARALRIEQTVDNRIIYRRCKTGTDVVLPLSEPAAKLVEYYAGGRSRGVLIRDLPTDQCINRLIKLVCKEAEIKKNVSAKTGRHTFATFYLTKNSGDLATLSRLMGHTSIENTMVYAHTLREDRERGIQAFNGLL